MIKLLGGNEVSEEMVKFLVDNINNTKSNFDSVSGVEITIDSIKESFDGLSVVWDTIGGANKINKANVTVANLDTSSVKSIFQNQMSTNVNYTKEPVLTNTVYHKGESK